jgi:hypothetical protein
VEFYNYTTWHYFKHLFFLKDQYIPQESSEDIPPNENKNFGDDLTDTLNGSESLQHTFIRQCDEKEQITSHASTVDIPLKEKETLSEDQTYTGDGKLQTSQHSSKGLCHENGQISSHASSRDLTPKGEKTLRDDQTNLRDGKLQSSQHTFKGRCHEKDQISTHTSSKDLSPKGKETLREDQALSQDGKLQSSQHSLQGLSHEKKQVSSHASRWAIPPKEKNILRTDQSDAQVGGLETSHYSGSGKELKPVSEVPKIGTSDDGLKFSKSSSLPNCKRFCLQKGQSTSHAGSNDLQPKENKILKADQTDSRDEEQGNSQFSGSGKEHKPSAEVSKGRTDDPGLEFSNSSALQDFKHLCPKNDRLTSQAGNMHLPPKKRKDFSGIETDIKHGEVGTSKHSAARKKLKPSAEVQERKFGDGLQFSDGSNSPNFKHLCLQKNQITFHADSKGLPSKEKISRGDQTHSRKKGHKTSKLSGPGKDHKRSAKVSETRTADCGLELSKSSTLPNFKHLCPQTDRFTSHAGSKDLPTKEKKTLRADQTDSRVEELQASQFSDSGKGLRPGAEMRKTVTGDPGLEFSNSSTLPNCKHFFLQKCQLKPHASSGDIPPKENKNSRDDQTGTRNEGLESSKLSKFDGVPANTMDAETDASGPLSPNKQLAALSIDSHTTKHGTTRSSQTDIAYPSAEIQRPILKVSEDEYKARDEDISFFESLIPHTKGLSPERKMLLRIKTQELIYNFIYNKKN